jgi:hypothetical protein
LLERILPLSFDTDWRTRADDCLVFGASMVGGRKFFLGRPLVRYRIHGGSMHSNVRAMEADMLRAYAKAFAEKSPDLEGIRRQAYSRLHAVLAGSFFGVAQYRSCLRHTARSLLLSPGNLERFAGLPWRRLRRVFQRAR